MDCTGCAITSAPRLWQLVQQLADIAPRGARLAVVIGEDFIVQRHRSMALVTAIGIHQLVAGQAMHPGGQGLGRIIGRPALVYGDQGFLHRILRRSGIQPPREIDPQVSGQRRQQLPVCAAITRKGCNHPRSVLRLMGNHARLASLRGRARKVTEVYARTV